MTLKVVRVKQRQCLDEVIDWLLVSCQRNYFVHMVLLYVFLQLKQTPAEGGGKGCETGNHSDSGEKPPFSIWNEISG